MQSARPGRQRGHNKVTRELAALMDRGGAHPTASGARLYQGREQASARRRLSPSMLQEQGVSLGNQGTPTMLQLLREPAAWRGLGGRGAWLTRGLHEHSHIYIYSTSTFQNPSIQPPCLMDPKLFLSASQSSFPDAHPRLLLHKELGHESTSCKFTALWKEAGFPKQAASPLRKGRR